MMASFHGVEPCLAYRQDLLHPPSRRLVWVRPETFYVVHDRSEVGNVE